MDISRKRPTRRGIRPHRELLTTITWLLRLVPAMGAGVAGAAALGTVAGALYIQSYFEALHAAWAIDLVPYAVMLRTGLMGGAVLVIALATTLTMVVSGGLRERGVRLGFLGAIVLMIVLASLRQWGPTFLSHLNAYVDLGLVLCMAFGLAFAVTAVISRRIIRPRDRRRVTAAAGLLASALVLLPLQRGRLEADVTLGAQPSGLHPDVCIKGDFNRWRLVRTFDGQMLVTHVGADVVGYSRLISHSDVSAILGPGLTSPCPNAPPEAHR